MARRLANSWLARRTLASGVGVSGWVGGLKQWLPERDPPSDHSQFAEGCTRGPGAKLEVRGNLEALLHLTGKVESVGSPGALPHVLTGIEDRPQEVVLPGSRRPGLERRLS